MRAVGVTEFLVGLVPEWAFPVLLALTFLGDTAFLVAATPIIYWLGPRYEIISRRDGARLLAVTLGALALVLVSKHWFALPRPPANLTLLPKAGYAFPSGHATGSAAVYVGAARLVRWQTRRLRYLLAGSLIGVVALTRLFLGVHFLVDVVVGVFVGVAFAHVALFASHARTRDGFLLAAVAAVAAAALSWPSTDGVAALGGALGAAVTWTVIDSKEIPLDDISLPVAAVGLVVFGGIAAVSYFWPVPLLVVFGANAITGSGFVGLPAIQNFSR